MAVARDGGGNGRQGLQYRRNEEGEGKRISSK
jgi:hypothetical protein